MKKIVFSSLAALILAITIAISAITHHNPFVLFQNPYYMTSGGGTAVRLTYSGGQIAFAENPNRWYILPIPHLRREGLGVNGQWVANMSAWDSEICIYQMDAKGNIESTRCIPDGRIDPLWIPVQLTPSADGQKLAIQHSIDRSTTCPGTNLLAFTVSVYDFTADTISTLASIAYTPQFSPTDGQLGFIHVSDECQSRQLVVTNLGTGEATHVLPANGFAFKSDGTSVITDMLVDPYVRPIMFGDQLVFTREIGDDFPEVISIGGYESYLSPEMGVHEIAEWNGKLYISYFDTQAQSFKLVQYSP